MPPFGTGGEFTGGGGVALTAATTNPMNPYVGSGADGVVLFDGTATYPFIETHTGVAPNLVYTLTRDVMAADGSGISAGITVNTACFRIYCKGTWTDNGIRQNNGSAASGTNNGTGGAIAAAQTLGTGSVGANGSTGAGAQSTVGTTPFGSASISDGGAGGAGGTAGGTAGGASKAQVPPSPAQGSSVAVGSLPSAAVGGAITHAGVNNWNGGVGGSSGAGDGTNVGGGGGAGGSFALLNCLIWKGNGTVQCNGGNGGTPTTAAANKGVGGGGGGGGGFSIVNCHINLFTGTHQCLGGTHGTGLNGTGGAGAGDGTDGGNGIQQVNVI